MLDRPELTKEMFRSGVVKGVISNGVLEARPYTTPLSHLTFSSCAPVTTQLIPLKHSEMPKLS